MAKIVLSLIFAMAYFSVSTAIKCFIGLSSKELTLEIGVRKVECPSFATKCATTRFVADGITSYRGYCASDYGPYLCTYMEGSAKTMTDCKSTLCSGDYCNHVVEQNSRRTSVTGKGIKCYTGIQMFLPQLPIATGTVPTAVDQCEDHTNQCMTVQFTHLVTDPIRKFKINVPTQMRLCKPSYSTCENHCRRLAQHITIADCKASCCKGDMCNPF